MMNKLDKMYLNGMMKLQNLMKKRVAGESHFLAVAVGLIIVVVIGVLFKDTLSDIFTSIFTQLKTKVLGLF